jgi:hypothetical protein
VEKLYDAVQGSHKQKVSVLAREMTMKQLQAITNPALYELMERPKVDKYAPFIGQLAR